MAVRQILIVIGLIPIFLIVPSTATEASSESVCVEERWKDSTILYFRSPKYPAFFSGDLLCTLAFKLRNDTVGILLEFKHFETDGVHYGLQSGHCDMDMMFLKGFGAWSPPPLCGSMSSYQIVIDDDKLIGVNELMLHAVMSSPRYRWNIKVTQIFEKDFPEDYDQGRGGRKAPRVRRSPNRFGREHSDPVPLVMGGVNTRAEKVPWQASIRLRPNPLLAKQFKCDVNEGIHFCGGSIIGPQTILTAAHCLQSVNKAHKRPQISSLMVVLGDTNKCRDEGETLERKQSTLPITEHKFLDPAAQVYEIETVALHYAYSRDQILNDIAVIKLKTSIRFTDSVNTIKMARRDSSYTGSKAFLSGWGCTSFDPRNRGSQVLQSTDDLRINKRSICTSQRILPLQGFPVTSKMNMKYRDITKSTICTKNLKKGTFAGKGDSGGPLVVFEKNASEPTLVGVVSFHQNIGARLAVVLKTPSASDFFQSVSYYRNWIDTALVALELPR